jgi:lipid-A-disaccharide synthase
MDQQPRIAVVAGELSGDRLGAALIQRVRERRPDVRFVGVAGPRMRAAGCEVLADSDELSVMGLAEVVGHLPRLLGLRRRLLREFIDRAPRLFIGIDAPDFNLGLERRLKRRGIDTLHWVSPSVWAWRRYRLAGIRRSVNGVFTLFPFEAAFYRDHGVAARFVGHPLADEIAADCGRTAAREALDIGVDDLCLALLPGSRRDEVARLLPVFLRTVALCRKVVPELRVVLPLASPQLLPLCRAALQREPVSAASVTLLDGDARRAICAADTVLVASGTATLECLLSKRAMVVAYRMHPVSYALVRRMLRVPWVSLPNILLDRPQVPELLQSAATPERLARAVLALLTDTRLAATQVAPFEALHRELRCDAAARVADALLDRI